MDTVAAQPAGENMFGVGKGFIGDSVNANLGALVTTTGASTLVASRKRERCDGTSDPWGARSHRRTRLSSRIDRVYEQAPLSHLLRLVRDVMHGGASPPCVA